MRALTLVATAFFAVAGCAINPPPNGQPCVPAPDLERMEIWRGDNQVELGWYDMPVTVGNWPDECRFRQELKLVLPESREIAYIQAFVGFDNGDSSESDISIYNEKGEVLYRRAEHLEEVTPECYDAWDNPPRKPMAPTAQTIVIHAACWATDPDLEITARCHLQSTIIFKPDGPPPTSCVPPGEPAAPWGAPIPASTRAPKMGESLQAAKIVVGDRCGEDPTETLRLLGVALEEAGVCAAGPWGKQAGHGAELAIRAPDLWRGNPLYEQFHPVGFTDGCYTLRGKYIGAWPYEGDATTCTAPLPTRDDPRSQIALNCRGGDPTRKWCDATPLCHGCDYCAEIGMPCMPGTGPGTGKPCIPRCDCPVRPEGSPDRAACEQYFTYGGFLWQSDGRVEHHPTNPARARCQDCTYIEVCQARNGNKCTRVP